MKVTLEVWDIFSPDEFCRYYGSRYVIKVREARIDYTIYSERAYDGRKMATSAGLRLCNNLELSVDKIVKDDRTNIDFIA